MDKTSVISLAQEVARTGLDTDAFWDSLRNIRNDAKHAYDQRSFIAVRCHQTVAWVLRRIYRDTEPHLPITPVHGACPQFIEIENERLEYSMELMGVPLIESDDYGLPEALLAATPGALRPLASLASSAAAAQPQSYPEPEWRPIAFQVKSQ